MKPQTLVTLSIALGLLTLIPGVGLLLGPPGIVCAVIALVRGCPVRSLAVAALVLCVVGFTVNAAGGLVLLKRRDAVVQLIRGEQVEAEAEAEAVEEIMVVGPDGALPTARPKPGPSLNRPAPPLALRDLGGEMHSLAQYKGKIVIVNCWATWCGWCVKEMPDLAEIHARDDVVVLGLSMEDVATQKAFVAKNKVGYPLLVPAGPLPPPFDNVRGLPTSFVIDAGGTIRHKVVGYQPVAEWERILKELVAEG